MGIFDVIGGLVFAILVQAALLLPVVSLLMTTFCHGIDAIGKYITDGDETDLSGKIGLWKKVVVLNNLFFKRSYGIRTVWAICTVFWVFFAGLITVGTHLCSKSTDINAFAGFFSWLYEVGTYVWSLPVLVLLVLAGAWSAKKIYRIKKMLSTHINDRSAHNYDQNDGA